MSVARLWAWAMLAFVLHDLGWILWNPVLALPVCAIGIAVVACIVVKQCRTGLDFDLAVTIAALGWLVGNVLWNASEFVFEEDVPAGFLAQMPSLANLDDTLYSTLMWIATILMIIALVWFLIYCLACFVCLTRTPATGPSRPSDEHFAWGCVPLNIYLELSLIPWIIMDFGWCMANLISTQQEDANNGMLLQTSAVAGLIAIALEVDCARRTWAAHRHYDALLYVSELLWVLGNTVWMLEDVITGSGEEDWPPAYWTAVALFGLSALLSIPPILFITEEDSDAKSEDSFLSDSDDDDNI